MSLCSVEKLLRVVICSYRLSHQADPRRDKKNTQDGCKYGRKLSVVDDMAWYQLLEGINE